MRLSVLHLCHHQRRWCLSLNYTPSLNINLFHWLYSHTHSPPHAAMCINLCIYSTENYWQCYLLLLKKRKKKQRIVLYTIKRYLVVVLILWRGAFELNSLSLSLGILIVLHILYILCQMEYNSFCAGVEPERLFLVAHFIQRQSFSLKQTVLAWPASKKIQGAFTKYLAVSSTLCARCPDFVYGKQSTASLSLWVDTFPLIIIIILLSLPVHKVHIIYI